MRDSWASLVVDDRSLSRLVTPYQSKKTPVYRWYNLNHSYSKDLVLTLLKQFDIGRKKIVFDPFCGTGTTLLAAREAGFSCFGLDIMPLSVFVSRGKIMTYCRDKALNDYGHIYPSKQFEFDFESAEPYLQKCFPPEQLTKLLHLRFTISQMPDPERSFFAIALLNILKPLSFTKNDGAFLRFIKDADPKKLDEVFPSQVQMMLDDLDKTNGSNGNGSNFYEHRVLRGDARDIPFRDESIDCVITSPPYLNRHDYTRIYAIELLFSFLEDNTALKQLRYKMLRSNVEAKETVKIADYQPPARLAKLIDKLKDADLPNRKVVDMVWGYFEDMYGVLKEMNRVCRRGSKIAFVVGNCKYGGIMFPVDELLAEIGQNAGLTPVKIIAARYRGNAPQQMKEFGKESSRESIVILERVK